MSCLFQGVDESFLHTFTVNCLLLNRHFSLLCYSIGVDTVQSFMGALFKIVNLC